MHGAGGTGRSWRFDRSAAHRHIGMLDTDVIRNQANRKFGDAHTCLHSWWRQGPGIRGGPTAGFHILLERHRDQHDVCFAEIVRDDQASAASVRNTPASERELLAGRTKRRLVEGVGDTPAQNSPSGFGVSSERRRKRRQGSEPEIPGSYTS